MNKNFCLIVTLLFFQVVVFSQTCPAPIVPPGDLVNVITNPGFETGVIAPGNAGPHALVGCCSSPGTYMISNLSNNFNAGMIAGITPHSGTNMLMIDGVMAANATAWEQTITVQPNKLYYFSAWITALSSVEKSELVFQVEPLAPVAGPSIDISTYFIPVNGPAWQQEFGTWFSGTTTSVKVRLINTNPDAVGGSGNDYAIDDLMFRPTCVGTNAGPKPNLGNSIQSLCNSGGTVDLNTQIPNHANHVYTWFRNASGVANVTTPDILENQTILGTYVVCLDSAGCVKSDTVEIQSSLTLDLGPDLNLCNPSFKLLDTRITAPGFTISWFRDNVIIPSATGPTYMATGAGTYRVDVTNGGSCTGSDEITITSQVDATVGATYCAPGTTSATVSVVNSGGIYNWYSASTGGSSLGSGLTYTATGLTTGDYTYYVENSLPQTSGAGLMDNTSTYLGPGVPPYGQNNVHAQNMMMFTANLTATITSITVILDMNANYAGNVTITLEDRTVPGTVTSTYPVSNNPGTAGAKYYVIPLSLSITAGRTYWLSIVGVNGSSFAHRYSGANIPTFFPRSYTAVTLLGGQTNGIYPGLFDWKFSHLSTCARTPAVITSNCALPISLLDFTATYAGLNTVNLNWSTSSEVNNSHFTIQRSTDGVHFTDVKTHPGAGNSNSAIAYNDVDYDAYEGISYYRLMQTDFDGNYSYSQIVKVSSPGDEFSFTVIPTLCDAGTDVKINVTGATPNQNLPLQITDVLGRTVYSEILNTDEAGNVFTKLDLSGSSMLSGTYVVTVASDNEQYKQKIVLMK